jgi:hypothetical protein
MSFCHFGWFHPDMSHVSQNCTYGRKRLAPLVAAHEFEKGNRAGGRKPGSRNRLSNAFVEALAKDFEQYGDDVIKVLRVESPSDYCRLIGSLVPKEVGLEVTNRRDELREWLGWITPQVAQAMAPKSVEKAPDLPVFPARPQPLPRPRVEPFNASEAAAREPANDKPRLQIAPRVAEEF